MSEDTPGYSSVVLSSSPEPSAGDGYQDIINRLVPPDFDATAPIATDAEDADSLPYYVEPNAGEVRTYSGEVNPLRVRQSPYDDVVVRGRPHAGQSTVTARPRDLDGSESIAQAPSPLPDAQSDSSQEAPLSAPDPLPDEAPQPDASSSLSELAKLAQQAREIAWALNTYADARELAGRRVSQDLARSVDRYLGPTQVYGSDYLSDSLISGYFGGLVKKAIDLGIQSLPDPVLGSVPGLPTAVDVAGGFVTRLQHMLEDVRQGSRPLYAVNRYFIKPFFNPVFNTLQALEESRGWMTTAIHRARAGDRNGASLASWRAGAAFAGAEFNAGPIIGVATGVAGGLRLRAGLTTEESAVIQARPVPPPEIPPPPAEPVVPAVPAQPVAGGAGGGEIRELASPGRPINPAPAPPISRPSAAYPGVEIPNSRYLRELDDHLTTASERYREAEARRLQAYSPGKRLDTRYRNFVAGARRRIRETQFLVRNQINAPNEVYLTQPRFYVEYAGGRIRLGRSIAGKGRVADGLRLFGSSPTSRFFEVVELKEAESLRVASGYGRGPAVVQAAFGEKLGDQLRRQQMIFSEAAQPGNRLLVRAKTLSGSPIELRLDVNSEFKGNRVSTYEDLLQN